MEYKLESKPSRWKKEYDDGRKYNKKWESQFAWLAESEDSRPFCQWCNKYLIPRKHALTAHDKSTLHKKHADVYGDSNINAIQQEISNEQLVPVTSVPSMSMPSIEVLGASVQTGQELQYTNETGTVFTYVEGTAVDGTNGQITYFTEAPPGSDPLSGVIKECFTVRDDANSYIASAPHGQNTQSIPHANGHHTIMGPTVDKITSTPKRKLKKEIGPPTDPIRRKVATVSSPEQQTSVASQRKRRRGTVQRSHARLKNSRRRPRFPLGSQFINKPAIVPTKLYDQHFGGIVPSDSCNTASSSIYMRGTRGPKENSGISEIFNKAHSFEVHLELPHFNFDDLKVRINGKMLEIIARHEEKDDEFGTVFRHLVRKYTLPDDAIVENICSSLSNEGVLMVEVPKKQRRSISKDVPIMIRRDDSIQIQGMPEVQHEEILDTGIHVAHSM